MAKKPRGLYLTPYDHAFASGPVFKKPASPEAAEALFDDPRDGALLWRIFERFEEAGAASEGLRLSLTARAVNKNREPMLSIGRDCALRGTFRCNPGGRIQIGELVYVGDGTIFDAMSAIEVGDGTLIAHGVQILDNDSHPVDADEREAHFRAILGLPSDRPFTVATKPVSIGRRCWIGFNSAIMKGVTIGAESIIASGSIVTKDVPPRCIAAGNPARVVKRLDEDGSAEPAPSPEPERTGLQGLMSGFGRKVGLGKA